MPCGVSTHLAVVRMPFDSKYGEASETSKKITICLHDSHCDARPFCFIDLTQAGHEGGGPIEVCSSWHVFNLSGLVLKKQNYRCGNLLL
jgi:hypothetical protein